MTDPAEMDDEAIERLCAEATPGPWQWEGRPAGEITGPHICNDGCDHESKDPLDIIDGERPFLVLETDGGMYVLDADAKLMAASRTLVPALLARANGAEKERNALAAVAADYANSVSRHGVENQSTIYYAGTLNYLLAKLNAKGG